MESATEVFKTNKTRSYISNLKIHCRNHGQLVGTLSGHTSWVLSVAFSPDNEHFVSSSADHTVRIWEGSTRQCIHTFSEHSDQVTTL